MLQNARQTETSTEEQPEEDVVVLAEVKEVNEMQEN